MQDIQSASIPENWLAATLCCEAGCRASLMLVMKAKHGGLTVPIADQHGGRESIKDSQRTQDSGWLWNNGFAAMGRTSDGEVQAVQHVLTSARFEIACCFSE